MDASKLKSLDDVRAFVKAIDVSRASSSGNWSVGQNLWHLAAAVVLTNEAPGTWSWWRRVVRTPLRWRVMYFEIPKGVTIPAAVADRLTPADVVDAEAARERLLCSLDALEGRGGGFPPHPILGPLTKGEWVRFHVAHCRLHLGVIEM